MFITEEELDIFDVICTATNLGLVKAKYKGEEVAVIVLISEVNGEQFFKPLSLLITDSNASYLEPDNENFEENKK